MVDFKARIIYFLFYLLQSDETRSTIRIVHVAHSDTVPILKNFAAPFIPNSILVASSPHIAYDPWSWRGKLWFSQGEIQGEPTEHSDRKGCRSNTNYRWFFVNSGLGYAFIQYTMARPQKTMNSISFYKSFISIHHGRYNQRFDAAAVL